MATIAETLLARTARDGGATISLVDGEVATHTTGFYVGGVVDTVVLPLEPTLDEYADAVNTIRHRMGGRGYVGSWRNHFDCSTAIDASEWYADADTALAVARQRGELAVWEIAGGTELETGVLVH